MLPDRRRMHLHDGPIDLIIEAFGDADEIRLAYRAASARFVSMLDELCGELTLLRRSSIERAETPTGTIAQRMCEAVRPYAARIFITPMAAVAGAVAEEILLAMTHAAQLKRAYVNNGGDIAIHLAEGEQLVLGMAQLPNKENLSACQGARRVSLNSEDAFGTATIDYRHAIRGVATSGWRGRSFSLGIADSVTVLAATASMADAAATVIANAVDLPGHPEIGRLRARDIAPDSDLGERLVTQSVGPLAQCEILRALAAGCRVAESLRALEFICSAALSLQGQTQIVGEQCLFQGREITSALGVPAHA